MSGEYASASAPAKVASVAPPTAGGHPDKRLDAHSLVCETRARHRYYRSADAEVAHALESLAVVAERNDHDLAWASPAPMPVDTARTQAVAAQRNPGDQPAQE